MWPFSRRIALTSLIIAAAVTNLFPIACWRLVYSFWARILLNFILFFLLSFQWFTLVMKTFDCKANDEEFNLIFFWKGSKRFKLIHNERLSFVPDKEKHLISLFMFSTFAFAPISNDHVFTSRHTLPDLISLSQCQRKPVIMNGIRFIANWLAALSYFQLSMT